MRYVSIALLCIFTLCGATCSPLGMFVKQDPVHCFKTKQDADNCKLPCDPALDLPDGKADTLNTVAGVNRGYLVRCTVRRDACYACVDALQQAKVIDN